MKRFYIFIIIIIFTLFIHFLLCLNVKENFTPLERLNKYDIDTKTEEIEPTLDSDGNILDGNNTTTTVYSGNYIPNHNANYNHSINVTLETSPETFVLPYSVGPQHEIEVPDGFSAIRNGHYIEISGDTDTPFDVEIRYNGHKQFGDNAKDVNYKTLTGSYSILKSMRGENDMNTYCIVDRSDDAKIKCGYPKQYATRFYIENDSGSEFGLSSNTKSYNLQLKSFDSHSFCKFDTDTDTIKCKYDYASDISFNSYGNSIFKITNTTSLCGFEYGDNNTLKCNENSVDYNFFKIEPLRSTRDSLLKDIREEICTIGKSIVASVHVTLPHTISDFFEVNILADSIVYPETIEQFELTRRGCFLEIIYTGSTGSTGWNSDLQLICRETDIDHGNEWFIQFNESVDNGYWKRKPEKVYRSSYLVEGGCYTIHRQTDDKLLYIDNNDKIMLNGDSNLGDRGAFFISENYYSFIIQSYTKYDYGDSDSKFRKFWEINMDPSSGEDGYGRATFHYTDSDKTRFKFDGTNVNDTTYDIYHGVDTRMIAAHDNRLYKPKPTEDENSFSQLTVKLIPYRHPFYPIIFQFGDPVIEEFNLETGIHCITLPNKFRTRSFRLVENNTNVTIGDKIKYTLNNKSIEEIVPEVSPSFYVKVTNGQQVFKMVFFNDQSQRRTTSYFDSDTGNINTADNHFFTGPIYNVSWRFPDIEKLPDSLGRSGDHLYLGEVKEYKLDSHLTLNDNRFGDIMFKKCGDLKYKIKSTAWLKPYEVIPPDSGNMHVRNSSVSPKIINQNIAKSASEATIMRIEKIHDGRPYYPSHYHYGLINNTYTDGFRYIIRTNTDDANENNWRYCQPRLEVAWNNGGVDGHTREDMGCNQVRHDGNYYGGPIRFRGTGRATHDDIYTHIQGDEYHQFKNKFGKHYVFKSRQDEQHLSYDYNILYHPYKIEQKIKENDFLITNMNDLDISEADITTH